MVIWETVQNILGGVVPTARIQGFPKTLKLSDFMSSTVAVVSGKWNTLGEYTIPAQQKYHIGYGNANQPDNQGYVYVYLKTDSAVEIKGKIRLTYADANKFNKHTVYEEEEEVLHGSSTDRSQMKALPALPTRVRPDGRGWEDDRVLIEIYPDSSATVGNTTSVILIPVTQY